MAADPFEEAAKQYKLAKDDPFAVAAQQYHAEKNGGTGSKLVDNIGEFVNTAAGDAWDLVKLEGNVLKDPFGTIGGMAEGAVEGSKREFSKAKDAYAKGDYQGTAIHGLGTIPVIGATINDMGEDIAGGHYGKAAARVAEAALLHKAQKYKPDLLKGTAREAKAFVKVDPKIAASKWLGPTPTEEAVLRGTEDHLEDTLAHIQDAHGKPITSNTEAIVAATKANRIRVEAFDKWMERGKASKAAIVGNNIIKAIWDAIPADLKEKNPEEAERMLEDARRAYGDKMIPVEKADTFRKNVTDRINFYKKSTGEQIRSLGAGSNEALLKAERDALANGLYEALDPENGGAGPRTLRQQQARIIRILDGARKRQPMATSTKPVSKLAAAKEALPQAWRAVRGAEGFGHNRGASLGNLRTITEGTVDPRVRETFGSVGKPTSEIPLPKGALKPKLALAAPNARIETTDGSGSVRQPFYNQPEWTQPGTRNLLPESSSTQLPGFQVTDTVPVQDSVTGRLSYVPAEHAPGQLPAGSALRAVRRSSVYGRLTAKQQAVLDRLRAKTKVTKGRTQVRPELTADEE